MLNRRDDMLQRFEYVEIRESQKSYAEILDQPLPSGVVGLFGFAKVTISIDLDCKPKLGTEEVEYVGADALLSSKFQARDLLRLEPTP